MSIRFDHITKRFGATAAVDDLNLEVVPGEFLVIVGPSGCGKTTALRMVAGLEHPTDGRIHIDGVDVTDTRGRDRNLAMVFQSYALYPHLTVEKNVTFGLRQRKFSPQIIGERLSEATRMLELMPYLKRRPGQLSGGQRQRVALGRATVRHTNVLLMDEPLSNLDAQLRNRARAELAELHRTLGSTVLYVTHDQVEAMTMGHRIAIMDHGVLQQCDTPQMVYARPANVFVASFIGSPAMNLVPARVLGAGPRPVVSFGAMTVECAAVDGAVNATGDVTLGIRPEQFLDRPLNADRADPGVGRLHGVVRFVEPHGADQFVTIDVHEQAVTARLRPDAIVRVGDHIVLGTRLEGAHLFDATTGRRMASLDTAANVGAEPATLFTDAVRASSAAV